MRVVSSLFFKLSLPSITLDDVFTFMQLAFEWFKNLHPLVPKLITGGVLIIGTGWYWERKGYSFLLGVLLFLTFADFLGCNTHLLLA